MLPSAPLPRTLTRGGPCHWKDELGGRCNVDVSVDMLLFFFNVRAVFLLSPPLEILSSGIPVSTISEQKPVTCWSWREQASFISKSKKSIVGKASAGILCFLQKVHLSCHEH